MNKNIMMNGKYLNEMRVTLVQMDTVWRDTAANIARFESLVDHVDTDLIVLPEMWSTGFIDDPLTIAEYEHESTALAAMQSLAVRKQTAVCGSLACRTLAQPQQAERGPVEAYATECHNRCYFVWPDGHYVSYDKRHLFAPGGEGRYYTAGQTAVVARYRGWSFLLAVCYDLRFPVWLRYGGKGGTYDAIICVANWPQQRQRVWQTLTEARAIENQSYVIAVNRTGQGGGLCYNGGSRIVDSRGEIVTELDAAEQTATTTLLLEPQQRFRQKFPVLADRD